MSDWIPIALGRDVPAGATRSVLLDGREVVIWRDGDGAAHVSEDRCPHRGMRLSFGFVRGNSLNCLYHGWQYGAESQCLKIPAHPDLTVPPTIRANAYASAEAGGMIWMNFDAAEAAPDLPDLTPVVSVAVMAEPDVILAALSARVIAPHLATTVSGSHALHIGWHRVAAGKTMLHAAIEGGGDVTTAMRQVRVLRDAAEQEVAA